MIYLDTSAFIKLYIREEHSETVNRLVVTQDDPLPLWFLHDIEMRNALRLKVFRGELEPYQADELIRLMTERLRSGVYFTPELDVSALRDRAVQLTRHTPQLGCRSLDILHVAAANLISVTRFITFDDRQGALAKEIGLSG